MVAGRAAPERRHLAWRGRRFVIGVAILGVAAGAPVWSANPASAAGHARVTNVRMPWRDLAIPAVDGRQIAFYASNAYLSQPGKAYLESLDIPGTRPKQLVSAPIETDPFQRLRMSSKWIVWLQQAGQGPWQLWAMSRSTGMKVEVDSSSSEGLPPTVTMFPSTAVFGNRVVWTTTDCSRSCYSNSSRAWNSYVKTRLLPSGRPRVLYRAHAPCQQDWPSTGGDTVVWMQTGACPATPDGRRYGVSGVNLLTYDLGTGRLAQLTHNGMSSMPTTNGRFVAWKVGQAFASPGTIVLLDRKTGVRRVLSPRRRRNPMNREATCRAGPAWPRTTCDFTPELLQHAVVWWEGSELVASYGLRTHRFHLLAKSSPSRILTYPTASPDGAYAVWTSKVCTTRAGTERCDSYISYEDVPQ